MIHHGVLYILYSVEIAASLKGFAMTIDLIKIPDTPHQFIKQVIMYVISTG